MDKPKNESVVSQLLDKLKGAEDNNLYDLNGNKIGEMKDGKITIGGNNITKTITIDDEDES